MSVFVDRAILCKYNEFGVLWGPSYLFTSRSADHVLSRVVLWQFNVLFWSANASVNFEFEFENFQNLSEVELAGPFLHSLTDHLPKMTSYVESTTFLPTPLGMMDQ